MLTLVNRFDEIGKAARDAAGWHACLDALEAWLDGVSVDLSGRWGEVHPGYVSELRPRGGDDRAADRVSSRGARDAAERRTSRGVAKCGGSSSPAAN